VYRISAECVLVRSARTTSWKVGEIDRQVASITDMRIIACLPCEKLRRDRDRSWACVTLVEGLGNDTVGVQKYSPFLASQYPPFFGGLVRPVELSKNLCLYEHPFSAVSRQIGFPLVGRTGGMCPSFRLI
jgi:hypothetical protein